MKGIFSVAAIALVSSFVFFSSCSKGLNSPNELQVFTASDTTITDSTIFVDLTLDGNRVLGVQSSLAESYAWGTLFDGLLGDTSIYFYNRFGSCLTSNDISSLPSFSFSFGNWNDVLSRHNIARLPSNFIDSFFTAGSYPFSTKTKDTSFSYIGTTNDTLTSWPFQRTLSLLSPGVNILWQDSTGVYWQTLSGTSDQTGSYFTIVEAKPVYEAASPYPYAVTLYVKLDCKLYDGMGRSIHLTNGRFRLFFPI
jgi:hypothetical protein